MSSVEQPVAFADARVEALARLVDYAGLFPPASLDMAGAVAGYRRARAGPHAFMLGRFVCAAPRLEDLAGELVSSMVAGEQPWPLTVLVGVAPGPEAAPADLAAARDFATMMGPAAAVEAVDFKLPPGAAPDAVAGLGAAAARLGPVQPYFEVPLGPDWRVALPAALDAVAAVRSGHGLAVGAKLRCGGTTAELFPSVAQVAAFVAACRDLALPFKATAGLHHPFRHRDPATGFHHHGFLNLLAATALAAEHGLAEAAIAEVVADEDPASFQVTRRAVSWRYREVGPSRVGAARRALFTGYGSCDFDEPTSDLGRLGVLPVEAIR